ncbi:PREDICTED: reticulon-1-B isoform X2 [Bactrocera latifrons]|uniref:Reticulon-like protein n=1 Tax=Bactrocera latifrons TaxID=174628 RepID=A0A0K8VS36_BACLA|nr:PREDICTED: reticulon-1-B isoform X2 [Bactrocera latifrons]
MDFNFADLKKEAAATAEDVFSHTADAAKQATNATYDLLSGGGGRASTGAQDDNSHTEHYFANEQKDIDFEHVDPQAFVQRMSAGAKEAQEQLDAKFAQHTNDFDDFLTNASKDLHSFGSQLQQDTKQGVHDFMNAERGLFSGAGDINKQTVEVSAPTTVPVISNKPAEHAVKEGDLLNFSVGDAAEKHAPLQPFEEDFETHFAPTAPAAPAPTVTTLYDDDLAIGKPSNSASASNKDSDTDSPSLSCNPSPAKKNPVTAALKEQDNDKFISSEDLLGDFKDERTATPDFQVRPEVTKPAVQVKTTPGSVPITDLDAEEESTSLFSQPKHSQVEEIKETGNSSTKFSATLPVASATAAAAPKPAAVSEPIAAKPLAPTTSNKDTTEIVKPKTAPPVPPKESKPSHQQLDQPKIVSVEEIFYKYGLVESLIYWRDVKKSGITFGAGLITLLAISCFSVISVFAYLSLLTLAGTVAFRIYKSVLQAIQKTPEGHPFKEYLDIDLTLSQEKVQNIAGVAVAHVNGFVAELRRLFLVEDLVDSIKFGVILWVLTYIGGWFNGMTLVILAFVSLFTLPKVYENNKQSIDTYLDLVRSKLTEITDKIKAAIPIGKKPIAAESDKDK